MEAMIINLKGDYFKHFIKLIKWFYGTDYNTIAG
jgi:hypothetical protein